MSKDHFYFNRNDRIVALILLSIIIIVNIIRNPWNPPVPDESVFTDSLVHTPDTFRRTVYVRDTVRRKWYVWDTVKVEVKSVSYAVKSRPLEPLDLNAVDSVELVRLPGIGPATAMKIIRYRERLGGYSDITQFIITDTIPIRQIQVNRATLAELRRHPYLDFYQARAIVEYRGERGVIKGPEQLSFMEEFTARDLERLKPYLDFSQDQ